MRSSFCPCWPFVYKFRAHSHARSRWKPALHHRNPSFAVANPPTPHLLIYGFGLSSVSTFFVFAKKPHLPKLSPRSAHWYARAILPVFGYCEVSGEDARRVQSAVPVYSGKFDLRYSRAKSRPPAFWISVPLRAGLFPPAPEEKPSEESPSAPCVLFIYPQLRRGQLRRAQIQSSGSDRHGLPRTNLGSSQAEPPLIADNFRGCSIAGVRFSYRKRLGLSDRLPPRSPLMLGVPAA